MLTIPLLESETSPKRDENKTNMERAHDLDGCPVLNWRGFSVSRENRSESRPNGRY